MSIDTLALTKKGQTLTSLNALGGVWRGQKKQKSKWIWENARPGLVEVSFYVSRIHSMVRSFLIPSLFRVVVEKRCFGTFFTQIKLWKWSDLTCAYVQFWCHTTKLSNAQICKGILSDWSQGAVLKQIRLPRLFVEKLKFGDMVIHKHNTYTYVRIYICIVHVYINIHKYDNLYIIIILVISI